MFAILLVSVFTYINVPCADMRLEPTNKSKMDTQAYYSEAVELIEEKGAWAKIKTPDGYPGWVKKSALLHVPQKYLDNPNTTVAKVNRCAAHVFGVNDTEYGPILTLPYDSRLEVIEQMGGADGRWIKVKLVDGSIAYIQRGDVTLNPQLISHDEMIALSHRFMDLPYTWGGRSSFGYDCSGFMQMLHRQMGIAIPRNSREQAAWEGFKPVALNELIPGDLIFFGPENRITHVVMYIGQGKFIHATVAENKPYITISDLSGPDWNGTGRFTNRLARRLK